MQDINHNQNKLLMNCSEMMNQDDLRVRDKKKEENVLFRKICVFIHNKHNQTAFTLEYHYIIP